MIRLVMVFLATWAIVFFGLSYFWHTTRAEKLNMVKMGLYSFMTAFLAIAFLSIIVILF
jgi:hypothetical protein